MRIYSLRIDKENVTRMKRITQIIPFSELPFMSAKICKYNFKRNKGGKPGK